MTLTEFAALETDPKVGEYLRASRSTTQAQIDAQARSRACYDLTPSERMAQATQRTFFGESAH